MRTENLLTMPALEVFGQKWKVSSDDLVFPYLTSIGVRVWWFALTVYVLVTYDKSYSCDDEKLLKIYLSVLIGLHAFLCTIEFVAAIISARGTMANPTPRRWLPTIMYMQAGVFVLEFAWDIVGVVWAFDPSIDCSSSHSVLVLTRIVLVWNLVSSVGIALYMFIRIGVCGPCCRRPPKKMRYECLGPETAYGGRRLSRINSGALAQHLRQRKWQWKLQFLCCCLRLREERQRSVFHEVSATLADAFTHFRGYVPSDILAGIALLAMEEKNTEDYPQKALDFDKESVCKHFLRVVRYLKFAAGSYGWPVYCRHKGILGWSILCKCSCCACQKKKKDLEKGESEVGITHGDNVCGWNTAAVKRLTGLLDTEIIYASFQSEVFCPAFYVACDHRESSLVVVIRGSLSLHDALTDLSAEPSLLTTVNSKDIYAHKGMMHTAHAIQLKLESECILESAFEKYPQYRLVVVGHSLGAGCASLLAILLRPQYPKLHCYAYAPPGGLIDMSAVPYTRSFITSVVLGNDLVPRLSLQNFEGLSERVLYCIQNCQIPKYWIFLKAFFHWLGVCKGCMSKGQLLTTNEMELQGQPLLSEDYEPALFDEEENIYDEVADILCMKEEEMDPITGKKKLQTRDKISLFLPGRIIHITWGPPESRCCGLSTYNPLQAHWVPQTNFSKLIVEQNMFKHHLPDEMIRVLAKLQKQERLPI